MLYTLPLTESIWLDITLKFFVGIVSSSVFVLLLLWVLKPKIKISNKICFKTVDGESFYIFKIVNKSRFDAYSVEFELYKRAPYIVDKRKINHQMSVITLSRNSLYSIPRYKSEKGVGDHAVLIRTFEDISEDIDDPNVDFMLSVCAKHGLSNLTTVTTKTFEDSTAIHNGDFKFGKNLGVC